MKTNKLILGTFAAFALLACSKENPVQTQDTPLEQDEVRFVNISIGSPPSLTKAPDFNAGEEYENSVTDVQLLFFDKAGNRVGTITTINEETWKAGEKINDSETTVPNVNRYYAKATQVSLRRGENLPSYVMAFVNAISGELTGPTFDSLENIEKYTLSKNLYNGKGFAMSNSVYYGKDAVTGVADSKIMATPISIDQLFKTKTAAEEALAVQGSNTAIVDIYVERYAAKVQFGFSGAVTPVTTANGKSLTFVPEAWAINADEDEYYITKSFFASSDSSEPATLAQMDEALVGWDWWNDADNFRSYWAQSANYWATAYPRVSDEIIEAAGWKDNKQTADSPYKLKYYSYEEIILNSADGTTTNYNRLAQIAPNAVAGQTSSNVLYARENTVDAAAFSASLNPKATVPAIVLVGKYKVLEGEVLQDVEDIFYLKGNSENLRYFTKEEMYADFLANQALLFSDATGTKLTYSDNVAGKLAIEHPAAAVRGELLTDSRYVTLQLTEAAMDSEDIFTYDSDGNIVTLKSLKNEPEDTDENKTKNASFLASLNSLLWQEVGSVRGYYKGHAYFYIPIKHLGFDDLSGQEEENPNSADFDWTEAKSGAFGIVRNHFYNIEVTGIKGVGSGIPSADIPIVPPLDDEDYYIAARINILNWAVVPKYSLEL